MCFQLSIAIVCQNIPPQGTLPSIAVHRLCQKTFFENLEKHANIQNCNKKRYFMHFQLRMVIVVLRS